jgi:transcription elongation factor GreA
VIKCCEHAALANLCTLNAAYRFIFTEIAFHYVVSRSPAAWAGSDKEEENMSVTYLTREGYKKLEDELEYLRNVRRKEIADRLREAMEGDDLGLDPDAEFEAAKNDQAFLEGRIKELEILLASARVIEEKQHSDTVQVGSRVTIQEEGAEPEEYIVVGAAEADPRQGRISHVSPLGKALIDHKEGDVVLLIQPGGSV